MNRCECASLAYYPNDFNDEHINIGFLLHDIEKGTLKRMFIEKIKRLKVFDDRLDDERIAMLFEVAQSALNDFFPPDNQLSLLAEPNRNGIVFQDGFFERIGRNFSNSLRFVDVFSANPDDVDAYFADNASLALYFDQDLTKRPDHKKVIKLLSQRVSDALISSGTSFQRSFCVKGEDTFGETIRFDYQMGNILFKIINPLSEDVQFKINLAKQWAFNISHYFAAEGGKKVWIIVPDNWNDDPDSKVFSAILSSAGATIVPISSLSEQPTKLLRKETKRS